MTLRESVRYLALGLASWLSVAAVIYGALIWATNG